MRINNFARKSYLHKRRLAIIQKAHTPIHVKIQLINNRAIDKKINLLYDYDTPDEIIPSYTPNKLIPEISTVNLAATQKDIKRLLKNTIVTNNNLNKLEAYNAAKKVSDRLTTIEVERINKNLNYISKTLSEAELDIKKYNELINKLPSTVSRQDILEKALIKGENYKGREYSYKELNQLSRDLEKYKTNHLDYETAKIENEHAQREGYDLVNNTKTWIWSTLENTRHENMDGETVGLYEKFTVTNEITGDTDYLRFPGDIENDNNNCSNICNCECNYEIN